MRDSKITCEDVQSMLAENLSPDLSPNLSPAEREHLAACDICAELLTARLLRETSEVSVPPGFAARVRSRLPAERAESAIRRQVPAFGFITAVTVLLLAALTWIALSFVAPQSLALGGLTSVLALCTFTCEIAGIGLWLGVRGSSG